MNKTIVLINKMKLKDAIKDSVHELVTSKLEGKDYQNWFNNLDIILKIK